MTTESEKFASETELPEVILAEGSETFHVDPLGRADRDMDKLVKILASEMDYGSGVGEFIEIKDLPLSWQKHIEKRKADGFLAENKNSFTKAEIIRATTDPDSYTPSNLVDKVFARVKKEKIDFDDLPTAWQERLKDENIFGNFTVEYLKEQGALDKDIATIKAAAEAKRVDQLKKDIKETASSFLSPEEAGQVFLDNAVTTEESPSSTPVRKSWWGRVKSRFGF